MLTECKQTFSRNNIFLFHGKEKSLIFELLITELLKYVSSTILIIYSGNFVCIILQAYFLLLLFFSIVDESWIVKIYLSWRHIFNWIVVKSQIKLFMKHSIMIPFFLLKLHFERWLCYFNLSGFPLSWNVCAGFSINDFNRN